MRLQKLLFLFTRKQAHPAFYFIPYKFGCFSYTAQTDIAALNKTGTLIENEKSVIKKDPSNYFKQLKTDDQNLLMQMIKHYGKMSTNELIRYTYLHFPFFAIKSEIAGKYLNQKELDNVHKARPKGSKTILFTIGYEGISLEEYLLRLIKNDVKVLVDVRNNPLSMKFGFGKSQLKKYCAAVGIDYVHLPELGIPGNQRINLNAQKDYDRLFDTYKKSVLRNTTPQQQQILDLLKKNQRIALTCFESDICRCHRFHLAEAIKNLPGFHYEVKHI